MKTARIGRLRDAAVFPEICYYEFYLHFHRSFELLSMPYDEAHYGEAFRYACEHITPVIGEDERIVGRTVPYLTGDDLTAWNETYHKLSFDRSYQAGSGQDSHMAIDYELLLSQGIEGILARIARYEADCKDNASLIFYHNCRLCLEGVLILSDRYAALAASMAETCGDAARRAELLRIAAVCAKVPRRPAEHFDEAVQAAHFVSHVLSFNPLRAWSHQQFQLGRPDRFLLPYYEKDRAEGSLSYDDAQELIDCLAIQINNRVPNGLSSGYMLGGRDVNGKTVANDLTVMGLQAIDDLHLVYPSVGLCCTDDMPDAVLRLACEILSHGCSHPALFNDDLIRDGLRAYGLTPEESCCYIHSTCVEITPVGCSNVWVASPYTNLPGLLLSLMDKDYPTFDALLDAYRARLSAHIKANFESENANRIHRDGHSCNPLLSCFVHDCLERGRDIEHGGARYNWIMPSFVGMANLVDSLYAIRTLVYEEHALTLPAFREILDKNFDGCDALRARIMEKIPKYGNDNDDIDALFGEFSRFLTEECRKHTPVFSGARLIPSVFCWIMHERFGSETGATPDGRPAGFPLGDGSGPAQGREHNGPTASILSATKWDHKAFIGGVAVNMKFSKKHFSETSAEKVLALIRTYLARGGFELQINVVDRETLLDAKAHPELHNDLVVRIGGYSDYFVRLPVQMQEELLLRTEHTV